MPAPLNWPEVIPWDGSVDPFPTEALLGMPTSVGMVVLRTDEDPAELWGLQSTGPDVWVNISPWPIPVREPQYTIVGSTNADFTNLQDALLAAAPGETIVFLGVHDLDQRWTVPTGVHLLGYGPAVSQIQYVDATSSIYVQAGRVDVRLSGFGIDGGSIVGGDVGVMLRDGADRTVLEDLLIENMDGHGIRINQNNTQAAVTNSTIRRVEVDGVAAGHGIYGNWFAEDTTLEDIRVSNTQQKGVYFANGSDRLHASDVVVVNTGDNGFEIWQSTDPQVDQIDVRDTVGSFGGSFGHGVSFDGADRAQISNVRVRSTKGMGIEFAGIQDFVASNLSSIEAGTQPGGLVGSSHGLGINTGSTVRPSTGVIDGVSVIDPAFRGVQVSENDGLVISDVRLFMDATSDVPVRLVDSPGVSINGGIIHADNALIKAPVQSSSGLGSPTELFLNDLTVLDPSGFYTGGVWVELLSGDVNVRCSGSRLESTGYVLTCESYGGIHYHSAAAAFAVIGTPTAYPTWDAADASSGFVSPDPALGFVDIDEDGDYDVRWSFSYAARTNASRELTADVDASLTGALNVLQIRGTTSNGLEGSMGSGGIRTLVAGDRLTLVLSIDVNSTIDVVSATLNARKVSR